MLKNLVNAISSIGKSIDGATFLKEEESVDILIAEMEALRNRIKDKEAVEAISQDMLLVKYGQVGEKNVAYELKNSFIPMYILHGITIQHGEYKAQLDFVLITNKFICILETKKMNGDITINNDGDFIRHFKTKAGKTYKKEGMYSPISQNQRHVRILQDMLIKAKVIKNLPVLSLVVIANPKSIIDHKFASKEIKGQIVKHDQLTPRIKKMLKAAGDGEAPIVTMQQIAAYIIENHVEPENAFITKYKGFVSDKVLDNITETINSNHLAEEISITIEQPVKKAEEPVAAIAQVPILEKKTSVTTEVTHSNIESPVEIIKEKLIKYRLDQSRIEKIKAYIIFNNKQLDDILLKMPKTNDELMGCDGFGKVKVEKYGLAILGIVVGKGD